MLQRSPFSLQFIALIILITTSSIVAAETKASSWDTIKGWGLRLFGNTVDDDDSYYTRVSKSLQTYPAYFQQLAGSGGVNNDLTSTLGSISSGLSSFAKSSLSSSLAVVKMIPKRFEMLSGKYLSKSTVFGIRDTVYDWTGWVFRVDRPHKGASFDHLNINSKHTKMPDPHVKLPPGVVPVFGAITTVVNGIGKFVTYVAVAADAYMIGDAAAKDYKENGKLGQETAKSTVIVGTRWFGAFAGATVGNKVGTIAGGIVGTLCGGLGVPGAAVGSMIGTLWGGVAAGAAVNDVVQATMKQDVGYLRYFWSMWFEETLEIPQKM